MSYSIKQMEALFPPRYPPTSKTHPQWHVSTRSDGEGWQKFTATLQHSRLVWRLPVEAEQVRAREEEMSEGPPPMVDAWQDRGFPIGWADITPATHYGWDVNAREQLAHDMPRLGNPQEFDAVGLISTLRAVSNVGGYPSFYLTRDAITVRHGYGATRIELPEALPIESESVLDACSAGFGLFCRIAAMLIDGDENLTATVSKSVLSCDPTYRLRVEAESGAWVAIDLHPLRDDSFDTIRDEFDAAASAMTTHAVFDTPRLARKIHRGAIVRVEVSEAQVSVHWEGEDVKMAAHAKARTSGDGTFSTHSEALVIALGMSPRVTLSFGATGASALLQSADGTVQTVILPALPYGLWNEQRSRLPLDP